MGSSHPVVLWLWWQYFSTKRQIQLLFYLFIYFLCDFLLHGLFAKNDNKDSNNIFTYLRCIHVRFTREQIRFWQRLNLTLLLIHFLSFFFFFFYFLADTSKWVRLKWKGEGPSPRYSHSAAVGAAGMWVYGGLEGLQTKNDLWRWSFGKYQ